MDDKWFKSRQKELGVTADQIAARMGRNRSAVSHIYSGNRKMSLEWARAFAEALDVTVDEVLRRAGALDEPEAQTLRPGFAESDAVPFVGKGGARETTEATAQGMGGGRPGIDVWTVKSDALALRGYLPGDHILVDTHQSERCKSGDIVVAQIYNWQTGTAETILRVYEPPVLVMASAGLVAPITRVVDGQNVVIKGKIIASWRQLP
ncbi:helix-turn-helix domain-containing protein [Roseovarius mucosus]|uniref:XRE family transcriptional regulator n=1 Tax=Roseovarius mucosus TaxID=215743 RepID=UPI001C5D09CB|nr:XRE family transcriptional regulator [Roseovarius mucosus]MBW4972103.1 helix-turn-helix domain-containing protein [Roseovarius mucosus]